MEERIRNAVQEALAELGVGDSSFAVERPADPSHGDYAVNAAMVAARTLGKNPHELANSLAAALKSALGADASRVLTAGPGFVNIALAPSAIERMITQAGTELWGNGNSNNGKRVSVEYSNPNPYKEIHIGHLMSNIVGEALSRIIESSGATVIRDTFGGDVGPHVAKAIWALQKHSITQIESAKQLGEAYAEGSSAYDTDDAAKIEIDELNTRIYNVVARRDDNSLGDDGRVLLDLWRQGREISMEEFRRLFKILGTELDYEFFDSDTTEIGMRIVRESLTKGIFEKSDGAIIYRGEKKGLHTLVFVTSRGTPTYETKDIGLAFLREEHLESDQVLIVTAIEQIGHFNVVLAALSEIAPVLAAKTDHIPHGLLRLTSGKMSSRKGNVITAAELLEDVIARASEKNPDPLIAEQVAIGAVKYMILRQSPGQDIIFDPEKSLSLEGDSGPYLQYALVRARKILAYASDAAAGTAAPEEPYGIERVIIHFPEVAYRAATEFAPQLLTQYLTELASAWNAFYAKEQVLGSVEEIYKEKLTKAFANTMTKGLALLGIPAPEKM